MYSPSKKAEVFRRGQRVRLKKWPHVNFENEGRTGKVVGYPKKGQPDRLVSLDGGGIGYFLVCVLEKRRV